MNTPFKVGQTVSYKSRKHTGRGKIVESYSKATGPWVVVEDKTNLRRVTVRPSQVSK